MKKKNLEKFQEQPIKRLNMPKGERIVVTYSWDGSEPMEELYETNHNVYRLNSNNDIIWQVTRDDSIMPHDWWEKCHELAREEGGDGHRIPFSYITLEYADGTKANSDEDGDGTNILMWEEGCIIHLYGSGNDYILDPETGIAKNIAKKGGRVW